MAPSGGVNKNVVESYPKPVKCDAGMAKMLSNNAPAKNVAGAGKNHRISSTNGVLELLECPVCTSLMYPPIYQVFNRYGRQFACILKLSSWVRHQSTHLSYAS